MYMKVEKNKVESESSDANMVLIGTLLDTTWRMFVPVPLFTLIGYMIDQAFDMQPVAMLTGLGFGVFSSFALVAMQLRRITKLNNQEQRKNK